MKYGQLIEHNMRNNFIEKAQTKCGGETSPKPFSKNSKWSISLDQHLKFHAVCFYCIFKWRAIEVY